MNVLISACLLGQYCRYDGTIKNYTVVRTLLQSRHIHLIPICPEQSGGLATPREPAECSNGRVITQSGIDVTAAYHKGAAEAVKMARLFHCSYAVLKEKSPTCGSGNIYDGSFSHTIVSGDGIAVQYLKKAGISVIGESEMVRIEKLISISK
ncbi:MAG: DUF523 domain-containing protein [Megasphaera sp.]|uniref:DUF523 domain-containing protein n=1 Tax=Megasphaera sueciensis TaxID=349094 RepID=UPI003D05B2C2|nr:DUF523 domain-containing protein [Megasphaera sp.]MCI1824118.1 DUF523 domain-containing protein [Megasphaera sp.]